MLKYFALTLVLLATALAASLPASYDEPELFKNDHRIVGGHEVNIAKHPHQISMRRKSSAAKAYSHTCGGSIYKANVIVTAAHCIYNRKAESFIIVAGTNNRNGADGAVSRVSKIIMHENYNSSITNNDVALMILSTPLPLNGVTIAPITLASEAPRHGAKAVITGWGTTAAGGSLSNKLLEVQVPIVSNDRCDALYAAFYGPGRITDSMICAGIQGVGGKDACQGDSGGPLLVNHQLAGVVSWGRGCALPNYPGVYTNVAAFKNWIETKWLNMFRIVIFTALLVAIVESASVRSDPGRIIGGRDVSISKHPYQVSIRRKTCESCAFLHACGGIIYSQQAILTAAHCVYKRQENSFVVIAGTDNRSGADGFIARVNKIVIHENYNPALSENDIALIILDSALPLNGISTRAVSLASEEPNNDSVAVVSGWGATTEGGANAFKLQEVEVKIIDRVKCDASYGYDRIGQDMLCAGSDAGGKDACQYDSGGPLMTNNKLVGIVSWAIGCARPEYPGVYTNVVYFKNWIENKAKSYNLQ
ncbi:serine protease 53-like [Calliphora vicina]|uniref:serine protease 53-like n=1 Tax=Calliphora vicina TaxID=7373 RepID=UPI00325BA2B3